LVFRRENPIRGRMKKKDRPVTPETKEWVKIGQCPRWIISRPCCSDGQSCGQTALKKILKLRTANMRRVFFFMGIVSMVLLHG
jgi:hypothetical protein